MNYTDNTDPEQRPSNTVTPRISWIVGGIALLIAGGLLLMTVVMSAMGVIAGVAGLILIVAAFLGDKEVDIRHQQNGEGHGLPTKMANAMKDAEDRSEERLAKLSSKKPVLNSPTGSSPTAGSVPLSQDDDDIRINEAIDESFPASDPPSWNAGVEKHVLVK